MTSPRPDTARRRERSAVRSATARDTDRSAARAEKRAQQSWVEGAAPTLPVRATPPAEVVFHLGPTNSGKTYESLQALAATGSGVYAAPLRQLAHEAYEKLSAQLPSGTVGLSTGEEEIDPSAPIVCCTVEKAPMRGELLVLDESHWVADPDRGHHWARLLLTGEYREMHLISAAEAHPLLEPLVSDAGRVTVVDHRRLSRLDVLRAPVQPADVRPQTLVVAFSRKTVYAVAAELNRHRPGKVGVLYGALPPATRREVIERFTAGETEVLVTTDVIGHGINVPATTVLFAETTKFDGQRVRPLRSWETAQIAGRAGRYGLTGHGRVGVLTGVAGLRPDPGLLAAGAAVARGDAVSDLPKRAPRLRPELADLGAFEAVDLPEALTRWMAWAQAATRDEAMTADDVTTLVLRVRALLPLLRGSLGAAGDLETVWRLVELAIDYDPPRRTRWLTLAEAALRSAVGLPVRPETVLPDVPRGGSVEDFEQAAAAARDAQTLLRRFPGVAGLTSDDAAWVEEECAESISILLPGAISLVRSARCVQCGTAIAPRFTTCRPCSAPVGRGGGERDRRPAGGHRTAGRAAGRELGARRGGPRGRARRG
ncbi:helicase-related protein [Geodermatophilus sp. DSM 45219]|uniref:helicase-related protein n=1 Tax=Geodermatophilus sp. DSM 45219 TaxID=1881103 RepID=UPI00088117EE|nr:helicase-related protein [Geodermatophilus sp. DSM 45219]SDN74424.1 ATP-dependent RNA helicase SUPV3L1/SUV3 [Geodermatophilus sp. DSM 45219]